jgi:hypothetical protein
MKTVTHTIGPEAMPTIQGHLDSLLSALCELYGADGDSVGIKALDIKLDGDDASCSVTYETDAE